MGCLSGEGINVQLACCFDCRNGIGEWAGAAMQCWSASEMDDNLSNEFHQRIRWPGCAGLMCACDTLVIEMIAKPALPKMVQWYSLQAMCNALLLD